MGKRIFWIFVLSIVVITTIAVTYIQSEPFARLAKDKVQALVARDLGIDLNFDRLRIGVLPPSVSLVNVDLKVMSRANPLGLATDTVIKAERLGFSFRVIQAFSRGVQVNKVFFNDGEVRLAIPPSKKNGPEEKLSDLVHRPIHLELKDGFSISIRQLELRNTLLDISWQAGDAANHLKIDKIGYLAVTPAAAGTNLVLNLENIDFDNGAIKQSFKAVRGNIDASRNLLQLTTVDIQRRDAALHAAGRIVGPIDNLLKAEADLDVIVRSPLGELSDFEKSLSPLQGDLLADFKLEGKIEEPAVRGKIEVSNFKYGLWQAEKVALGGSYSNHLLTLERLGAEEKGGRIELAEKLELGFPLRASSPSALIKFTGARFEDFAGELKRTVNNLSFGIDGSATLKVDLVETAGKARLNAINLRPALKIQNFDLNNQTFAKPRAYKSIFKVQPFLLTGNVNWRGGVLSIPEAKIALASGALDIKGNVTDKGFDLTGASESVNMGKEIGTISGSPLTGEGAVSMHVHGPGNAVLIDFNLKQKNASFVRFNFGDVEGAVTYDDKNDLITVKNVRGKLNSANYNVNGSISIGADEAINLDATFGESDPNDLFAIFAEQIKTISWIPRGMAGTLSGTASVGGTYTKALETMRLSAKVQGKNLSYLGEMVHELDATATLDKGLLKARADHARKYETEFTGDIEYRMDNDVMKYSLAAPRGKLRNLDFLSSTGFPIDGIFSFESRGEGKWETLVSKTRFQTENSFMRARPMPPITVTYDTYAEHSDLLFSAKPGVEITGRFGNGANGNSSAKAVISNANFDYLLCAISRRNCPDPSLALVVNADAHLQWKAGEWRKLNGSGQVRSLKIAKSGFQLQNPVPVPFTITDGQLEATRFRLEGDETKLGLRLKGRVDGTGIESGVDGQASLKLLEFVSPLVEEARGRLAVAVALTGNLVDAKFNGNASVQDGFLRLGGLDAPVDSLAGKLRFNDSRISIDSLGGQLGGGSVFASGAIDLFLNRAPRFDVELILANNRLKFVPVNYAEISDAKLSFTGDKAPYLFGGTARVKKVVMRNNFDLGGQKGLQNARYLPEKVAGNKSFYEVKIRAIADGGVMVENNLLDAEFRGEVTLLGTFEFPQILARAELVRGKLLFRNTAFTLDHATIRVPTPEFFNPQFSIGGLATVDNYRISIFASGTVDRPKITFSSSPGLPQEDIVSLLAFGYRGEDARRLNPDNTNAITYSEVGSILLDQLKLNQNLQAKGIRVKVAPAFSESEERIIRRDANTQAAPKVYLQSQILRNLEASFGGTVGTTNQGQSLDAKLEYRLNRKASISAVYEQIPTLDTTKIRTSYGADLKFRWGFK